MNPTDAAQAVLDLLDPERRAEVLRYATHLAHVAQRDRITKLDVTSALFVAGPEFLPEHEGVNHA